MDFFMSIINVIYLEGHSPVDIPKVDLMTIPYQVFHCIHSENLTDVYGISLEK